MELRALGKTGLAVSALGFGCGAVGGLMVKGEPGEQKRAIGHAIEAGIRYFDTAPSYGDGRSEEHLGRVLQELGPAVTNEIVVGTAQVYFDALNPSAGYAGNVDAGQVDFGASINLAAESGVGVIVIRSLAAGAVAASDVRHPNASSMTGGGGGIVGERYEDDVR